MKTGFFALVFFWSFGLLKAQDKIIFAFPITDYIIERDSVSIVQVVIPEGLIVQEKAMGLLKKNYSSSDTSTAIIGNGRCQLIKDRYHYFGLVKSGLKQKPVAGNLIYVIVQAPGIFTGLLFNVVKHSIILQSVEENRIADMDIVLKLKSKSDEKPILEQLATDVRYTGAEMAKQKTVTDLMINGGKYKGKSLFTAMQGITVIDVEDFLKYINARPVKYAGNTWKFSEIMATWMNAGAPTVIE